MTLKDLIGYQLVSINDNEIIIRGNKRYKLEIIDNMGDCCGFNEIKTNLFFEPNNKRSPIISGISHINKTKCEDEEQAILITFYGEEKELANLYSKSTSETGYDYGANVQIVCKDLKIEEVITKW